MPSRESMTACFQISRLSIKTNFLSSDKVRHPDHRLVYRWIDVNVYRKSTGRLTTMM
jgi:hypothetical protein